MLPRLTTWFLGFYCVLAATTIARGQNRWQTIQDRGEFVWGADKEGGGPYVIEDENDPDNAEKLSGFEVELVDEVAKELSTLAKRPIKGRFQQGQWENIPSMLNNNVDVAINGFELTPARERDYRCSRPYYIYGLQLMGQFAEGLNSWNDLKKEARKENKWKIGVLGGSAAEMYLEQPEWQPYVQTIAYSGTTEGLSQAEALKGNLTLLDDCAAMYYADRYPGLKFIGRPVGQGSYVMLVDKAEEEWQSILNQALTQIIADGRMQKIYDRWDMSGKSQVLAMRDKEVAAARAAMNTAAPTRSRWDVLGTYLPVLLRAAWTTVKLACISMPLAILIGILVAIGRLYGPSWLRWPLATYVELIRGTPLMLQLYAIYFIIPQIGRYFFPGSGFEVDPMVAAITGLAINYSAYEAEIYRAGLQAIPRGQMEAALALGMSKSLAIRRIILPQAMRIVIPPVTNDFIALFKDTSVCSVVTVVELTKRYSIAAQSTGAVVELAILTSILYLLMSYPLSLATRWSEKRLGQQRVM
jgi:polar amino acid transport system substrate-binding protein